MFASLSQRVLRIFLGATLLAGAASARVISYSPYSSLPAVPAVQNRLNRHFVLVEVAGSGSSSTILPPFPYSYGVVTGQVIQFDSKGDEEPRVVFPQDGKPGTILSAATRENSAGVTSILILTSSNFNGLNPNGGMLWLLSTDSGTTWKPVPLPATAVYDLTNYVIDTGGPVVRARLAHLFPATAEAPFVVLQSDGTTSTLSAVTADGAVRTLAKVNVTDASIVGSDMTGGRWLVRFGTTLTLVDLAGVSTPLGTVDITKQLYGWIGSDNTIVFEERAGSYVSINLLANGTRHVLLESQSNDALGLFAIPTADHRGAWIVKRGPSQPTTLYKYTAEEGLAEQWRDVTAPEIEAIIAGQSGKTVLIQVHRTRPQPDQRLFKDPALAVWHAGERTPVAYDELFMNEQATKGFVHVDPDKMEAGEPFVFDSGATVANTGIIISPGIPGGGAGGGDVVQEWGVVRASLRQKLVLPGVARTNGAYGSYWLTDLVIQNPNDQAQKVTVDYVPTGNPVQTLVANTRTINLAAHELKVVPDALKTLFGIEDGGGAFYFTPELTVNVTSRTYSQTDKGTYGFGMNGIDVFTAARPRFPVSFAGAMQGRDFRTNLIITDVSGRGTEVAVGPTTIDGKSESLMTFSAPANGQQQANSIAPNIGLTASDSAALLLSPTRGEVVASVITIDNRTNDPTYFPPDLTIQGTRTIPAIGHLDGANNSRFRSDLFLFNSASTSRTITMQAKPWDISDPAVTINLTLLPNEARVIRDVLFRLFNKSGIARLIVQSNLDGVRVTSRTYNIDENGGTYGLLMPPLNNFQSGGAGDTLEILGVVGDKRFRTNLGLVDLNGLSNGTTSTARVEIVDNTGKTIDSFVMNIPSAGGIQVSDLFHARNLGDGPPAAVLRISPITGIIGAYATLNDNGTNDPTYLAANLAARQ